MTSRTRASVSASPRRGFTLVELMVALTAGLAVAAGAYTLSQTSLEVFQQEARMNAAQYSAMMGMNRLSADVRRAGFMSSANVASDPRRCGAAPSAPAPALLTAFRVVEGSLAYGTNYPVLPAVVTATDTNARSPDRLSLSGNYSSNEVFEFTNINTANKVIHLAVERNAIQRVYRDYLRGGPGICDIFRAGGWIRLQDAAGMESYVRLSDSDHCNTTDRSDGTGWSGSVQLSYQGDVPSTVTCDPTSGPGYANPVDLVEYFVTRLTPDDAALEAAGFPDGMKDYVDPDPTTPGDDAALSAAVTGEDTRLQLVRRRLAGDGTVEAGSAEIVGDYIVDLNARLLYQSGATTNTVTVAAFDGSAAITGAWQRTRAVGLRLATRTKGPEREANDVAIPTSAEPLRRFRLFPATATNRFAYARVRNLYAEVHLPNLMGLTW